MREFVEFRIPEEHASRYLRKDEGVSLGSIRRYVMETADPRYRQIGDIDLELKGQGRALFTAWTQRRRYSKNELKIADLFRLKIRNCFGPAGEECGTKYNENECCPKCGAGCAQFSDLFLKWHKIPKNQDMAITYAGEIVVSRRLSQLFQQEGINGTNFFPIRQSPASSAISKDWFQLSVAYKEAEITAPTRTGIDPFDNDVKGEYRCSRGDLLGLNLLSEVYIKKSTRGDADILATRQFIGVRRGLLRPQRILLLSPKVRELIEQEKLKGLEVEVAHLAD